MIIRVTVCKCGYEYDWSFDKCPSCGNNKTKEPLLKPKIKDPFKDVVWS